MERSGWHTEINRIFFYLVLYFVLLMSVHKYFLKFFVVDSCFLNLLTRINNFIYLFFFVRPFGCSLKKIIYKHLFKNFFSTFPWFFLDCWIWRYLKMPFFEHSISASYYIEWSSRFIQIASTKCSLERGGCFFVVVFFYVLLM